MENRRHGAARASKRFNKNRSHRDQLDKPYGDRSSTPRLDMGPFSKKKYKKKDRNPRSKGGRDGSPRGRFNPKGKSQKQGEIGDLPRIVSEMQVTDGKHRGKYLKSTDSPRVRPTSRRVREILFRILFKRVRAGRFLDLCAGSGIVGIEAISRGALIATFVERSAKMCTFIRENLKSCEIKTGHGEVFEIEAVPFLKRMEKRKRQWDLVFYDPPYDTNYDEVLDYFARGAAIRPGGILVVEHHSEMFFPEEIGLLRRWKVVVEGETGLSFYDRKS